MGKPGHCNTSGLFKQLWDDLLVSLYLEGVLPSVEKIQLSTQPANSPDTNVNDNGLFNALQAGYKRYAPRNASDMLEAVAKVYKEYPYRKINHMFLTLQTNYDEIIKCEGDNMYKIPHLNKVKLERLGQLPTVITVSAAAKLKLEETAEETADADYDSEEDVDVDQELEEEEAGYADYEPPVAITADELEALQREVEEDSGEESD